MAHVRLHDCVCLPGLFADPIPCSCHNQSCCRFHRAQQLFWLRNAIARERGIAAYRAWVPLERIRPAHIPQEKWEQAFAWPPNNQPPDQPLIHRIFGGILFYGFLILFAAILLQAFTGFSVLTLLVELATR